MRRPAKSVRLLQYRVEHRGEVARRGIDDLQDLGGRGLLLQGLACLGDQPRVLHRDHRLRGEALQQRDLLVGEWADFAPVDDEVTEIRIVLAQRDSEQGVAAAQFDKSAAKRIAGPIGLVVGNIHDVHHGLAGQHTTDRVARTDRMWRSRQEFGKRRRHAMQRDRMGLRPVEGPKDTERGVA